MLPTTETTLLPQVIRFGNILIEFEFNSPMNEAGSISEDFNYHEKTSYATSQVAELLGGDTFGQIVLGKIFSILFEKARSDKLDYLQKLKINSESCWCIDNGEVITLLLPSEY